jgi:hypothetical protein
MSWLHRHSAWAWLMFLVVGIIVVAAMRLAADRSSGPISASAYENTGTSDQPEDLAATARRMRLLQLQAGRLRDQLCSLQASAAERRERLAVVEEMLSENSFTDCPAFLQEDSTFRVLQKIVREAADSGLPANGGEPRLSTAATVARERLRGKLELLRDQINQEVADLEAQADTLRQRLRVQSEEVEHLQLLMQRELDNLAPPASDSSR